MGSLAVLAAAAFVFGAGAGLLWKDPGLVVAQWSGGTEEVAWSQEPLPAGDEPADLAAEPPAQETYETAAAEPARPVAKPTPPAAAAAPPAPPPAAGKVAAREVQPPPVSAAPPAHGIAVQVGAFSERKAADQLIARLQGAGFEAYAAAGDGGPWRVRVGPYADRAGAERAAARLKQEQKLPTWVLEETSGR